MTQIKKFSEYKKTNEILGWFSKTKSPQISGNIDSKTRGVGTEDNDLGRKILDKLYIQTMSSLERWLLKQSTNFQKDWIKKHANSYINEMCQKEKAPNNKWPQIFDSGKLTVRGTVEWIYKNEKQNQIDWSLVYDNSTPKYLFEKAESYYYFIDDFNSKKFRCEILKDIKTNYSKEGITITLTQDVDAGFKKTFGTGLKLRTRGADAKDYVPSGFTDDINSQSILNLSNELAKTIFLEAKKLFDITNPSAKKNARPPL